MKLIDYVMDDTSGVTVTLGPASEQELNRLAEQTFGDPTMHNDPSDPTHDHGHPDSDDPFAEDDDDHHHDPEETTE